MEYLEDCGLLAPLEKSVSLSIQLIILEDFNLRSVGLPNVFRGLSLMGRT